GDVVRFNQQRLSGVPLRHRPVEELMRRSSIILLAVCVAQSWSGARGAYAQTVDVRVDARIELLAAVNRLAGRSEYKLTRVPRWAAALDSAFAPFADHPAVAM